MIPMVTRAIARKLNIEAILQAQYIAGGNIENPNHILLGAEKVTRVNILGTIEDKYENPEANFSSLTIKHNESQIKVKFFEKTDLNNFQKGDFIKVIGKIREANEERFILGEIIKKQQLEYEKTREQELFKFKKTETPVQPEPQQEEYEEQSSSISKTESSKQSEKPVIEELGNVKE